MEIYLRTMEEHYRDNWNNPVADRTSPYNGEIRRIAAEHFGLLLKFGLIHPIKSSTGFKPDRYVRNQQYIRMLLLELGQEGIFATPDPQLNALLMDIKSFGLDGYSMFYKL